MDNNDDDDNDKENNKQQSKSHCNHLWGRTSSDTRVLTTVVIARKKPYILSSVAKAGFSPFHFQAAVIMGVLFFVFLSCLF